MISFWRELSLQSFKNKKNYFSMAYLKFVVGPVACGKTVDLILQANQLQTINGIERIKVLKPAIDVRFNSKIVKSATGLEISVNNLISANDNLLDLELSNIDCIVIDEIQFFTKLHIEQIRKIVTEKGINVICYGLLKDFRCAMFETSKRLLELCDDFVQFKGYCTYCKENGSIKKIPNEASVSMRITRSNGMIKPVIDGESICIGGIETFIPVCYECYYSSVEKLKDIK